MTLPLKVMVVENSLKELQLKELVLWMMMSPPTYDKAGNDKLYLEIVSIRSKWSNLGTC